MRDFKRIIYQMGFGQLKIAIKLFLGFWMFFFQYLVFRGKKIQSASNASTSPFPRVRDLFYCPGDSTSTTAFDRHYVYHTAWAARMLRNYPVKKHVDISSSLVWCTIVSAFNPIVFYDYRPATIRLDQLECDHVDITKLPFPDQSIESLSCMHVVEHIGLGRYGDPLNPIGDRLAMAELKRVLAPGGRLYFVVPLGQPKTAFHGHRIYSFSQISNAFKGLALEQFAFIYENGVDGLDGLVEKPSMKDIEKEKFGCGCFLFMNKTLLKG